MWTTALIVTAPEAVILSIVAATLLSGLGQVGFGGVVLFLAIWGALTVRTYTILIFAFSELRWSYVLRAASAGAMLALPAALFTSQLPLVMMIWFAVAGAVASALDSCRMSVSADAGVVQAPPAARIPSRRTVPPRDPAGPSSSLDSESEPSPKPSGGGRGQGLALAMGIALAVACWAVGHWLDRQLEAAGRVVHPSPRSAKGDGS
jgi:hypothetical protein